MDFRLLGPLEVLDAHGRPVELGTRKQRAVLAMLALEPGRIVSLDRLIDELWSGEPPSSAMGSLQVYIAKLRKALEPDRPPRTPPAVLVTREPGYLLSVAPGQVDLVRFSTWAEDGSRALGLGEHAMALRHLDRALAAWRGEPLAEFAGHGFARPVVARLGELRATAMEDRFEARLALGEGAACVPDLERLVEAQPFRERSWRLLVLALYRAGRQADALAALRRVRALLADELGLEPGDALRTLEQAVFAQSPELAAAVPGPARVEVREPAPAPPQPADGLIAREEPLRLITERLAATRRGRGGVLLVTGDAGIGKTRLAQAAADEAEARGLATAWGRCAEDTGAPAFWPWLQVLGAFGQDTTGALRLLSGEPGTGGGDPDTALFGLHERVLRELTASGEPRLVVLDDLHWADASSLRLLAFLAGHLHRAPVLVLATLRPEPGGEPEQLRDTLGRLVREPGTDRLTPAPFTREEVSAYLARRELTDPALAAVLHDRTGGNPFFLTELLRLLDSEHRLDAASLGVPAGVREVIGRRVARLPEPTQDLLRCAAVLGREVSFDALAAVGALPPEEVMALLEPAVASGLLAELPDGFDYRFSHALVRDALYAELGRLGRTRLHLRAGEALEAFAGVEASVLAHHFGAASRTGGAAKAVGHAVRAARRSAERHAYDEAVGFWRRALDALDVLEALDGADPRRRHELLIGLGRALRAVGDVEGARTALDEAIRIAADLGDRAALVSAIVVFGEVAVWNWRSYGESDERLAALVEGLLDEPLDDRDRAALLGTLGVELYYTGTRRAEGERRAAEAVAIARRAGDPALLTRVLNNYVIASWVPERERERRSAAEEMLAVPGLPAGAEVVARVFRMAHLLRDGELGEWERDLARCERLLGEVRRPEPEAMVRIAEAAGRTLQGRWEEAERLAGEFTALLDGSSMWAPDFPGLITLFTCRWAQGRAGELAGGLVSRAGRPDMVPLRPVAVLAAIEADGHAPARELVARWGAEVRHDWSTEFLTVVWGYVAARLGVPDPADLYARLAPYAGRLVVSGMGAAGWGSMHLVLAELARAMGETERARAHARQAHETHLRHGLEHWAGRSGRLLADLG
ncbi:AfsR/SARP family transcriptional regulator [Nonomuraea rhodomycinica]|uniref:AAA family ATPase n=1 Tax=Nonomuraea rhodomycinica TaxID=1712872 RepID=A0A7Y6IYF1_9ACTN|nr:AfsR/SARP family transcriptional regulator [Nonomuraea rhodomycinica]NUW46645.1 AAA family ATPase [Nonomuraea rhodomycinica]